MAEGKVRLKGYGFFACLCVLGVGALMAAVFADADEPTPNGQGPVASTQPDMASPEKLYAKAVGLSHEKLPTRVEAARALSRHQDGGPWIAILLVSSQNAPGGDKMEQERQASLKTFDLGVVAVALKAIPADVDTEVLWALTYLLDETERGRWSEETGLIMRRKSDHISPPIRELARTCLKGRVGSDHEWDASAWRTAILRLERPSTQPAAPSKDRKATPEPD